MSERPYWFERGKKTELNIMALGFLIMLSGIWFFRLWPIGFLLIMLGPILQEIRFRKQKKLRDDPLRCECGGYFITPWELGFYAPSDHLVCDNEHGGGRGIPCENWIVTPPDYQESTDCAEERKKQSLATRVREE